MKKRVFGTLPGGEAVEEYTLTNTNGLVLKVLTYGGIITELHVPGRDRKMADVVLGFSGLADYLGRHPYFGAITGRVAGRITQGKFDLEGRSYQLAVNNAPNHLHGGLCGFDKRLWKASEDEGALRLEYHSPDGEEGYPGSVDISVTYALTKDNEVVIRYEAATDHTTPFNPTNHSYFNLAGEGNGEIGDHVLQIFADTFVPTAEDLTLSGRRESVAGRANDFRNPRPVGEAVPRLLKNHGDAYLVRNHNALAPELVARVSHPASGRIMEVLSTETCVQFYTGVFLDGSFTGKSGVPYGPHAGLCLECQGYADGVNHPEFASGLLRPGETYRQTTAYRFSVE